MRLQTDTIAAISTPMGEGGIAVIRVSGPESTETVDKLFKGKDRLRNMQSHTVQYGKMIDPASGEQIEEVLVMVMKSPRSFTTEDVVEIHCHGGFISVNKVMDVLLQQNVRLAEPGEFTKRAFLNGRIDLSQAEAVIDLIRSKSDRAFSVALKQMEGKLSQRVQDLRQRLLELIAHIEVNIDYPEHDVESLTNEYIQNQCSEVLIELDRLLETAEQGKILREGIDTAIVGRPNVGKSSLLNVLAQENRAIVTDIPGTTRDVIEEYVNVGGIPLRLMDTAGLRETTDIVEQIGVERSRQVVHEADLILLMLNQNESLQDEEYEWLREWALRKLIVIVNKIDLPAKLDISRVKQLVSEEQLVFISVKEDQGLKDLEQAIGHLFSLGQLPSADMTYVSNARHIAQIKKAKQSLLDAKEAAENWIPIDMIQIDIRNAWEHLGEIVGDTAAESLLDQIFSQFCLGK